MKCHVTPEWYQKKKHCEILECHNVMNDGEIHIAKFNEYGEMEFWEKWRI